MLFVGLLLGVTATATPAQSVSDLVRLAVAADPTVAGARAQLRAAEQRVVQARAGFGPTAVLTGSVTDTRYREAPALNLRTFSARQATLQITQPVLRGTLFPALDAARAQLQQGEAAVVQAQADAALRLIDAAVDLLKSRETLALAQARRLETTQQVAAARSAFRIGTVPVTDVREAEAQVDRAAAEVVGAEADFGLQQQLLAELLAGAATDLPARGLDAALMPELSPQSLPEWLAEARLQNPEIQQARSALEVAQAEVRKAELGHAPTADLNVTLNKSSDTGTLTTFLPRAGENSAVGLSVNIPLFASGATQSKVRESVALRDKARADLDAAERKVGLSVRQSHAVTLTALAKARGLEAAERSQALATRAQRRSLEIGLKTGVDVLESQRRLFDARRELVHARLEAWAGYLRLHALSGRLGEAELQRFDAALVPQPPLQPLPLGAALPAAPAPSGRP